MDKDRIKGAAQKAKGKLEKFFGKAAGDAKIETEVKLNEMEGRARNAVGGARDAVRERNTKK